MPEKSGKQTYKNRRHEVIGFGKENVTVEPSNMNHQLYIGNCKETTIIVTKKINQICMERCEKVKLICQANVIGTLNVMKCTACVCTTELEVGSYDITSSIGLVLNFNNKTLPNSKIIATGCSDTKIRFILGDEEKEYTLGEELETMFSSNAEMKNSVAALDRSKYTKSNGTTSGQNDQKAVIKLDKTNKDYVQEISACSKSSFMIENEVKCLKLKDLKRCGIQVKRSITCIDMVNCGSTKLYLEKDQLTKLTISSFGSNATNIFYEDGKDQIEKPLPEQLQFSFGEDCSLIPGVVDHA